MIKKGEIIMVKELAARCKTAAGQLRSADTAQKNNALTILASLLEENAAKIIEVNKKDIETARASGTAESFIDRLMLDEGRIAGITGGIRKVIAQSDPVGGSDGAVRHPNGMLIHKRRVPLGVVGVIYESRPNVTIDIAALCIKSGNACLLRGGREAIHSNTALSNLAREALESAGLPADACCLITDTDRSSAVEMMGLSGLLDVLIPRGGAGLIKSVVENAKVPVIETGAGNCHIYVDDQADLTMAEKILVNAKCQRPSVCNAAETLLVARKTARAFLPLAAAALFPHKVTLHCCPESMSILGAGGGSLVPATGDDWAKEYNSYDIAVKVVDGIDEAAAHINRYNTGHSEAIITDNYHTARRFIDLVDAAAVYVNASTRFTDGEEFGLGAEIGISTQKLHARGPMGLEALTSTQYVIEGGGQVR
jgi:glutamate-5-semialdehyde dehydrogenase